MARNDTTTKTRGKTRSRNVTRTVEVHTTPDTMTGTTPDNSALPWYERRTELEFEPGFNAADRQALILRACETIHLHDMCAGWLARHAALWGGGDHPDAFALEQEIQQRLWDVWRPEYDRADPCEETRDPTVWTLPKFVASVASRTLKEIARDRVRGGVTSAPKDGFRLQQLDAILEIHQGDGVEAGITLVLHGRHERREQAERIARAIDPTGDPDKVYAKATGAAHSLLVGFELSGSAKSIDKLIRLADRASSDEVRITIRTALMTAYHDGTPDVDGLIGLVDHARHARH